MSLENNTESTGYLHDQGSAAASSRDSTRSTKSSRSEVSEKVKAMQKKLNLLPQMHNNSTASTPTCSEVDNDVHLRVLGNHREDNVQRSFDVQSSDPDESVAASSIDGGKVTASKPVPARYKLRKGFAAARNAEAGNWFTTRGSKTLPLRSTPPEGLPGSSSSSRASSLRIRNSRLPPAYTQPHDLASLIVASSSPAHNSVDNILEDLQNPTPPPSRHVSVAPLRLPSGDDGATSCEPQPAEALDESLYRSSRFSGTSGDADVASAPVIPPRSPARLSARNSAYMSNQGSIVSPVLEPDNSDPPEHTTSASNPSMKKNRRPWWFYLLLAVLWSAATSLTILGISNTNPLSLRPGPCTLGQAQTCAPPTLSFVHDMQMNSTLPKALQPCLSSLHVENIERVDIVSLGLELNVHHDTNAQHVRIQGGLVASTSIGTSFSDGGTHLMSNIKYAGVIDGNGDERRSQKLLDSMLKGARGRSPSAARSISAHGASSNMTISRQEDAGGTFLALFLACALAVQATLLVFFAIWFMLTCCFGRADESGGVGGRGEDSTWKQELSMVTTMTLRWVMSGVLGSAIVGGILVAFWQ